MKKVEEILKELGFNKDAPLSTQKAFVKNLARQANQVRTSPQEGADHLERPKDFSATSPRSVVNFPIQLELPGLEVTHRNNKKIS